MGEMEVVRIDWEVRRVWVRVPPCIDASRWQRIHHGPWAIAVGAVLLAWGLTDLHDAAVWFARGPQN